VVLFYTCLPFPVQSIDWEKCWEEVDVEMISDDVFLWVELVCI